MILLGYFGFVRCTGYRKNEIDDTLADDDSERDFVSLEPRFNQSIINGWLASEHQSESCLTKEV